MNRRRYYNKWRRYHDGYEKRAERTLRKVFKAWAKGIDFDRMTESNYRAVIQQGISTPLLADALYSIYQSVGKVHGSRIQKGIKGEVKAFSDFLTMIERAMNFYFQLFGGLKIKTIEASYLEEVSALIESYFEANFDLSDVVKAIQKYVNRRDFYRWQAERIARTETTAAANYSAIKVSEVQGFVMVKEWISSLDERTRVAHAEADGQIVRTKTDFEVGGEGLQFPGDPQGSAGNVINCRCAVAVVPLRDKSGNLVRV